MGRQDIRKKFQAYTDKYGMVHPWRVGEDRGPSSQNGLAYLGFYMVLLSMDGPLNIDDLAQVKRAIRSCRLGDSWVLVRSPECLDQQSWDDLTSVAAMLVVARKWWTGRCILSEYEKRHWFVPTERHPGATKWKDRNGKWNFGAYLGRFPQLRFMSKLAAHGRPGWLVQLLWAYGVWKASKKPLLNERGEPANQGSYRMTYLMCVAYLSQGFFESWVCTLAVARFLKSFTKRKITMADTQKAYFQPDHPFFELLTVEESGSA